MISLIILMGIGILFIRLLFIPDASKEEIECISNNSKLYVNMGCRLCENQRDILGNHFGLIDILDCSLFPYVCMENEIRVFPTWIIKNETHLGILSLEELKELAGCK